jgi:hypothetical protein
MIDESGRGPKGPVEREGCSEAKLAWETPRVIAAEAYVTEGGGGSGLDASSLVS